MQIEIDTRTRTRTLRHTHTHMHALKHEPTRSPRHVLLALPYPEPARPCLSGAPSISLTRGTVAVIGRRGDSDEPHAHLTGRTGKAPAKEGREEEERERQADRGREKRRVCRGKGGTGGPEERGREEDVDR